jgi:hypothetical protein
MNNDIAMQPFNGIATFASWDACSLAVADYCQATSQTLSVRNSQSVTNANRDNKKRRYPVGLMYRSVRFVCTHGLDARPRGKGVRVKQNYRFVQWKLLPTTMRSLKVQIRDLGCQANLLFQARLVCGEWVLQCVEQVHDLLMDV